MAHCHVKTSAAHPTLLLPASQSACETTRRYCNGGRQTAFAAPRRVGLTTLSQ
jgi:hypothetical protein